MTCFVLSRCLSPVSPRGRVVACLLKTLPCPVADDIGKILNLSPATLGGGARERSAPSRVSLGNRWLHDVLDVADIVKGDKVIIILDEEVSNQQLSSSNA